MEPRVLTYDASGNGEPLVLVPGGLTGWLSWIRHQARLHSHYWVVRVQPIYNEFRSAGKQDSRGYTVEVERESLRLTLDVLGIDKADFAGWSGGGKLLIEFALEYPERVRSLALVEPAAYWILEQLGELDVQLDRSIEFLCGMAGREVSEDDLAEFFRFAGLVEDPAQASHHPYWGPWVRNRMALSWASEEVFRSTRSVEELSSISCPVLLSRGTMTGPSERRVVDALAGHLPFARVVELDGDHASHIQSIDRFLEELEAHLHFVRSLLTIPADQIPRLVMESGHGFDQYRVVVQ